MCGRYALAADLATIAHEFSAHISDQHDTHSWEPEYNIAPTTWAPVVVERAQEGAERLIAPARWGLLPPWTRDPAERAPMFNARSETVAEKRSFSESYAHKRCIVPASGYYEWHTAGSVKSPHYVHTDTLMGFAGVYSWWKKGEDDWWLTYAILTASAPASLAWLHDRVPVIVPPSQQSAWLNRDTSRGELDEIVRDSTPTMEQELAHNRLTVHQVSKEVGNARNHGADLIRPVTSE